MKTKIKPFIGACLIVEMEAWDQEYVNMEVQGHVTFKKDTMSEYQYDELITIDRPSTAAKGFASMEGLFKRLIAEGEA